MRYIFLTVALLSTRALWAQNDSTAQHSLSISGYADVYYAYDFNKPANHIIAPFLYNYNRHNTFNVNLAMIKASYNRERVRGNIALMAGTYTNDNMTNEKGALKNIYEADAGVKIVKNKNLWIDAGILPSHIGWESAIGKDGPTLTRSIAAENSPYFETGARLSYTTDNGKWYIAALALNGWQRIERPDGNNSIAFGHQVIFKPNASITINSSSFIGNDKPDSIRQMRYFHDLYGQLQLSKHFALTLGLDAGAEQQFKNSDRYNTWYSAVAIAAYTLNNWNIALRGEYYQDPRGVIIPVATANGFKTWGYSLNVDRRITGNFLWRVEARAFNSKDKLFLQNNQPTYNKFLITSSLAFSF
ncbi:hypothetical protein A8C56_07300 [Niabella ginsenosidivorans]|uniref:Outer membrane protein n=1 Tax=Niabella ginsenosidivorans TaxID=1176587 RepID=A0A1A9I169_9BACT|nr:porin [Niabella ginsenosidivorans]ANH80809.1 hypothetical protein A8C56_07300 [Niabella ginsenosidivorans]